MKSLSEQEIQQRLYGRASQDAQTEQQGIVQAPAPSLEETPRKKGRRRVKTGRKSRAAAKKMPRKRKSPASGKGRRRASPPPVKPLQRISPPEPVSHPAPIALQIPISAQLPPETLEPTARPTHKPKSPSVWMNLATAPATSSTVTVALAAFVVGFITVTTGSLVGRPKPVTPLSSPRVLAQATLEALRSLKPFTIQVAVFDRAADAERLADRLTRKGYPTWCTTERNESHRSRIRVYVGDFSSREEATKLLGVLRQTEGFRDSFIRKR